VPAVSADFEAGMELLDVARSSIDFIRVASCSIPFQTLAENVQFKTCATMQAICCRTSSMVLV
jgi:hypothetical protein